MSTTNEERTVEMDDREALCAMVEREMSGYRDERPVRGMGVTVGDVRNLIAYVRCPLTPARSTGYSDSRTDDERARDAMIGTTLTVSHPARSTDAPEPEHPQVYPAVMRAISEAIGACMVQHNANLPTEAWCVDYAGILSRVREAAAATPPSVNGGAT